MNKQAQTQRPVHSLIRQRWSPRSFTGEPVRAEVLEQLFEAASWAPSAFNEQPWSYLYAHREDKAAFGQMLDCLFEGNRSWAANAGVLILSLAAPNLSANGKPNRHYMHDTGAANNSLLLEATANGLYGHMMGGFDANATISAFRLPETVEPVCFIALGHLGRPEQLPEPLRSREEAARSRKPVLAFTQNLGA